METHRVPVAPRALARIGGVLYLVIIVLGLFGEAFVRGRIVVSGNAAATVANLRSLESLWRIGIAAEFVLLICAVALTLILYVLLRPVSRFRSGYLPRPVGVLMLVAGLCYLVNSFALLLDPGLSARIFPAILIPAFIGEASLCLWLLVKGVNAEKWQMQPRRQR